MNKIHIRILSLAAVAATALTTVSCGGDSVPTVADDNVRVSLSTMQTTRAFTYSTDWFAYTDVPTLGIYDCIDEGTGNTTLIDNKKLVVGKASADWAYSENTKIYSYAMLYRGRTHHLFAYGPYDNANVSFDGKKFSWTSVPLASATDRVVINKITDSSKGVATLQMNHLYCKVDVRFNISEKYAELRTIEITDVKIEGVPQASFTGTYNCDFSAATPKVSWTALSSSIDAGQFTWKVADDKSDKFVLPYLDNGETKYGKVLKSLYIAPGLFNKETFPTFPITVTYNVYDKDGQETRHQQTVTNSIFLNEYKPSDVNGSAVPFSEGGYIYTFNITISPKYLYVLSDNDTESAFNIVIDPE